MRGVGRRGKKDDRMCAGVSTYGELRGIHVSVCQESRHARIKQYKPRKTGVIVNPPLASSRHVM